MAKGKKTGGRSMGTPNRTTSAVKEALVTAFDELGGVSALTSWGSENLTEFYKLWVKVLPQDINASLTTHTHEESLKQLADQNDPG